MNKINSEILLKADSIFKSYNMGKIEIPVLQGISFTVKPGEWVALCGASGSGKTTLLNIIGLLEKPDKGLIEYKNRDYTTFKKKEVVIFRRETIGFIFQAYNLLPELTVLENVMIAGLLHNRTSGEVKQRALELLGKMGLSDRLNHKPFELSGGEQQRTAIARSLINSPDLILADEPTGNLDSSTGQSIMEVLKDIHTENNKTSIVMVTHDNEIAKFADRTIHLKDGKIEHPS